VVCYACGTFSLALLALVPPPHGGGKGGGEDPRKVCCSVLQCVAVCCNSMLYARDVLSCNAVRYPPFRLRKQTKKRLSNMFAQCVAVVRSVLQSVAVACHEYVMHTFAFVPLLLPPCEKKGAGKSLCNFLLQCVAVICRLCEKGKRPRKYGAYTQRVRIFTCGTTVT